MLGFIFVCYDNKALWSAHTGKQDTISLLLTKPCVFSAKENWPQALHKPLLHILLSWFVNIVSIASIIIWGFHLLFLYNKHSSAPVVKAGNFRDSAESDLKEDLHSTGFVIFPACRMDAGVVTASGWEWGWLGGDLRRALLPCCKLRREIESLPGSLLPSCLPSGGSFPAMLLGFQPGGNSPVTVETVWLQPEVIPGAQRVEIWHSLFKNTLCKPALNLLFPGIFQIRKWLFALRVYINISGCVTFTSVQALGSVQCLEGWDSISRQRLLSGEQEGGENPVQVSLMTCT